MKKFLKLFRRTNSLGIANGNADAIPLRLAAIEDERTAFVQTGKPRAEATQVILYHPVKPQSNGDVRRRLAIVVPVPASASGATQRPFRVELQVDTPSHAETGNINANLALNTLIDLISKMRLTSPETVDVIGADGTVRTAAEASDLAYIAQDFRSVLQGDVALN